MEEEEVFLEEHENQVDHKIISSHSMLHLDDDDLVIDILDVFMDNPYNDFQGKYTNYNLHELDIELDEVQHKATMDMK